jgi:hypothetical protein
MNRKADTTARTKTYGPLGSAFSAYDDGVLAERHDPKPSFAGLSIAIKFNQKLSQTYTRAL